MKKVGIIGLGMVGSAIQRGLSDVGNEVIGYDLKKPETSLKDLLVADAVFICVPTPSLPDGRCDTSIVESVVLSLDNEKFAGLVVIKSTVEPGTTDRLAKQFSSLRLAFCPEFLRERKAYEDFVKYNDVCIIGAYSAEDHELIRAIHGSLPRDFALVTPLEAEFAKYFSNVFNALRIIFANEFYDVCNAAGADYMNVKDAIVKRDNITDAYLAASVTMRGYGGSCLPKDVKAFKEYAKRVLGERQPSLFDTIDEINKRYEQ